MVEMVPWVRQAWAVVGALMVSAQSRLPGPVSLAPEGRQSPLPRRIPLGAEVVGVTVMLVMVVAAAAAVLPDKKWLEQRVEAGEVADGAAAVAAVVARAPSSRKMGDCQCLLVPLPRSKPPLPVELAPSPAAPPWPARSAQPQPARARARVWGSAARIQSRARLLAARRG